MLGGLLVDVSRSFVLVLVELVAEGVLAGREAVAYVNSCSCPMMQGNESLPGGDVGVAVLGDLLVGLLGASGGGLLNGLRDCGLSTLASLTRMMVEGIGKAYRSWRRS